VSLLKARAEIGFGYYCSLIEPSGLSRRMRRMISNWRSASEAETPAEIRWERYSLHSGSVLSTGGALGSHCRNSCQIASFEGYAREWPGSIKAA
jgi:hypothetical protein